MALPNGVGPLRDLWHGQVHLHTAFWLCWLLPLILAPQLEMLVGYWAIIIYMPYLVVSYVGAWRSTRVPVKSLWAPNMYRLALVLFLPVAALSIADLALASNRF